MTETNIKICNINGTKSSASSSKQLAVMNFHHSYSLSAWSELHKNTATNKNEIHETIYYM